MGEEEPQGVAEEVKEDLLPHLEEIGRFEDLVAVWLFGSQATDEARPSSDVDVACYYDLPKAELAEISVRLAGRLPDRYDAEVFQLLPLAVRKEVLGGELLWARDKGRVYDVAIETLRDWSWYAPLYEEVIA